LKGSSGRDNNIVFAQEYNSGHFSPFFDENPKSRGVKALYSENWIDFPLSRIFALQPAQDDSLDWTSASTIARAVPVAAAVRPDFHPADKPAKESRLARTVGAMGFARFPDLYWDERTSIWWDKEAGRYAVVARANIFGRTGRSLATSHAHTLTPYSMKAFYPFLTNWEGGSLGDAEQFYSPLASPMPSNPNIYLSYTLRCRTDKAGWPCDVVLLASRDRGLTWSRLGTWIKPHPEDRPRWRMCGDQRFPARYDLVPFKGILPQPERKRSIIFVQAGYLNCDEHSGIYAYTFPWGRIGAIQSLDPEKPGCATTRRLRIPEGSTRLQLNKSGRVSVSVLHGNMSVDGFSHDNFHVTGTDSFEAEARWTGGTGVKELLKFDSIQLQFCLPAGAKLYGMRFA
jgi:hypothetical protein